MCESGVWGGVGGGVCVGGGGRRRLVIRDSLMDCWCIKEDLLLALRTLWRGQAATAFPLRMTFGTLFHDLVVPTIEWFITPLVR